MATRVIRALIVAAAVAVASAPARGQAPAAGTLARTADGRPDLSGIWQVFSTANWNIQGHQAQEGVPGGQLKAAILHGDEKSPGLIPRLRDYAQGRSVARRDAILRSNERQGDIICHGHLDLLSGGLVLFLSSPRS